MTALLDAVNRVLSAVSLPSTNSLDAPVAPHVALAKRLVDEEDRVTQEDGWQFNTEPDRTFELDITGKIQAPSNLILFSLTFPAGGMTGLGFLTVRDGFFYDLDNSTDVFTRELRGTLISRLDFEDCPGTFQSYVAARAARRMHASFRGDPPGARDALMQEQMARATALRADERIAQRNTIAAWTVQNIMWRHPRRRRLGWPG